VALLRIAIHQIIARAFSEWPITEAAINFEQRARLGVRD
jgi:hypothetical protein